jgi:hypothetical protein
VKTKRIMTDRGLEDTDNTWTCDALIEWKRREELHKSAVEIERIDHVAVRFDTRK